MKRPKGKQWTAWQVSEPTVQVAGKNSTVLCQNSYYVVLLTHLDNVESGQGWIHLSIRTHHREPVRDWRHFQRIKDELVGRDREAIELYPRAGRVVDEANSYHLWCLPAGVELQLGFKLGCIMDADCLNRHPNTKQRALSPDDPYALLAIRDMATLSGRTPIHGVEFLNPDRELLMRIRRRLGEATKDTEPAVVVSVIDDIEHYLDQQERGE